MTSSPAELKREAYRDMNEIEAADALVLFAEPYGELARGGKHFETGYAYAHGRKLIVVGRREHIFHHLPEVTFYPSIEEFLAAANPPVEIHPIADIRDPQVA